MHWMELAIPLEDDEDICDHKFSAAMTKKITSDTTPPPPWLSGSLQLPTGRCTGFLGSCIQESSPSPSSSLSVIKILCNQHLDLLKEKMLNLIACFSLDLPCSPLLPSLIKICHEICLWLNDDCVHEYHNDGVQDSDQDNVDAREGEE